MMACTVQWATIAVFGHRSLGPRLHSIHIKNTLYVLYKNKIIGETGHIRQGSLFRRRLDGFSLPITSPRPSGPSPCSAPVTAKADRSSVVVPPCLTDKLG